MERYGLILLSFLISNSAFAEDQKSKAIARTSVPVEQDACLDHSVKELGMSAKRPGPERRWNIGPQFLHPSLVPGGTIVLRMEKGESTSSVEVTVEWPGAAKPGEAQAAIEERLIAIVEKIGQVCGVIHPQVDCQLSAAGAAARPCKNGH
ncbi:MAG: hypothetical protein U1E65_28810 [Myxococcota bacterium]